MQCSHEGTSVTARALSYVGSLACPRKRMGSVVTSPRTRIDTWNVDGSLGMVTLTSLLSLWRILVLPVRAPVSIKFSTPMGAVDRVQNNSGGLGVHYVRLKCRRANGATWYSPVAQKSLPNGALVEVRVPMGFENIQYAHLVLCPVACQRPSALPVLSGAASREGILLQPLLRAVGGLSRHAKKHGQDLKPVNSHEAA
jgi:hypothetical protein